jgi:HK97 family phage major capsid protein
MWSKLMPASQESAVWVMNQSVIPQLIQLQDQAGNVIFLPNFYSPAGGQGGVQASLVPMLFGRPIIFTEKLPVLGTPGDVGLFDFSYYLLGDRQAIEVAASEHVNFLKNQMTWRFLHRVDGQGWLDGPYNYQDGVSQVSPFVALK